MLKETPAHIRWMLSARELRHRMFMQRYLELRSGTREQIASWMPVQIAAEYSWFAVDRPALTAAYRSKENG